MYRAVTLAALRRGVSPHDGVALSTLAEDMTFEAVLEGGVVEVVAHPKDVPQLSVSALANLATDLERLVSLGHDFSLSSLGK